MKINRSAVLAQVGIVLVSFFLLTGLANASDADVVGVWRTQANDEGSYLLVDIQACEKKLCGTILSAFNKDNVENAEYEHLGKQMIWGMKVQGNGKWSGGKIWAPDTDKKYRSKMALNAEVLKVSGCVAGGLICRSQKWTRP